MGCASGLGDAAGEALAPAGAAGLPAPPGAGLSVTGTDAPGAAGWPGCAGAAGFTAAGAPGLAAAVAASAIALSGLMLFRLHSRQAQLAQSEKAGEGRPSRRRQ